MHFGLETENGPWASNSSIELLTKKIKDNTIQAIHLVSLAVLQFVLTKHALGAFFLEYSHKFIESQGAGYAKHTRE